MSREKILIVDDENLIRWTLRERLQKEEYEILEAENGEKALSILNDEDVDLILLDNKLPDTTGLEILKHTASTYPDTMAIIMTAYSSVSNAVEAMKLGAEDYVIKPFSHEDIIIKIQKALEKTSLKRELRRYRSEQKEKYGIDQIIGESEAIKDVYQLVEKIALSAATTVLIQGESGTGKDLIAKSIHFSSDRADKPFMNITCSALPETLLESELFGYEKGAFTDAKVQKKGLLELANGGSVFLDEIADMGLVLQAKMLRFLEEKSFKRVGGVRDIRVDVRVLASTNKNMEEAVKREDFREDLYYRLKVIPITMPPLRERKDDIPLLIKYFIDMYAKELRKISPTFSNEALEFLVSYAWPGNIRELKNIIERLMILENKEVIELNDLPGDMLFLKKEEDMVEKASEKEEDAISLPEEGVSLEEVEKELVHQALEKTRWNQTRAARLLNISRDALRYKMKKFGFLK
jgi:DNA-binding NtrC family response regulator